MEERRYTNAELEQIIRQYSDMVYRVIVTRLKNKDSANDIYQDVFLKLVRREKALSFRRTFESMAAARNDQWMQ